MPIQQCFNTLRNGSLKSVVFSTTEGMGGGSGDVAPLAGAFSLAEGRQQGGRRRPGSRTGLTISGEDGSILTAIEASVDDLPSSYDPSGNFWGIGAAVLASFQTNNTQHPDLVRAIERLPRGCIDFFGRERTINQRIQELSNGTMMITFIDMRSQGGQLIPDDVYRRTYQQYWNRSGNPDALAKSLAIRGPGIDKTILLGPGYFDPGWEFTVGNFIRRTFPRGTEQLQELVLMHEYMHILNNMNEEQLFRKWTTGPGAAVISTAEIDSMGYAGAWAVWMTNGCPRRNR
ncbi:MAG: hypothetical protein IPM66_23320 [Acidobacteriota bacterium]|nr:MAG: hypothetical protein IPM66_23320 [Acidobacteriota bacterium]